MLILAFLLLALADFGIFVFSFFRMRFLVVTDRLRSGFNLRLLLAVSDASAFQVITNKNAKCEGFVMVWTIFFDDAIDWRFAVDFLRDFLQV